MVNVSKLIRDYSASVGDSFKELLAVYPSFNMRPMGVTIPRRGTLPSGREYSFHGIGCRFVKDGVTTDMDFGPDGRIDGFDAWRLHLFARSCYANKTSLNSIQTGLDKLLTSGAITKLNPTICNHLYFPTGDGAV